MLRHKKDYRKQQHFSLVMTSVMTLLHLCRAEVNKHLQVTHRLYRHQLLFLSVAAVLSFRHNEGFFFDRYPVTF